MVGLEPTTSCLQDKRSAIETTSAIVEISFSTDALRSASDAHCNDFCCFFVV